MSDTTPVTCPECGLPGQFVRDRGFGDGSGRVYECRNDTCGNHRLIFYAPTTEEMERQISARKTALAHAIAGVILQVVINTVMVATVVKDGDWWMAPVVMICAWGTLMSVRSLAQLALRGGRQ